MKDIDEIKKELSSFEWTTADGLEFIKDRYHVTISDDYQTIHMYEDIVPYGKYGIFISAQEYALFGNYVQTLNDMTYRINELEHQIWEADEKGENYSYLDKELNTLKEKI